MPNMITPEQIHDYIQSLREKKKVTVQAIATETGIAKGTLDNFFAGTTKDPKFINIAMITRMLGGSLDEMIGISSQPAQPPQPVHEARTSMDSACHAQLQAIQDRQERILHEALEQVRTTSAEKDQIYKSRYDVLTGHYKSARHDIKALSITIAVLVTVMIFFLFDCMHAEWGLFTVR